MHNVFQYYLRSGLSCLVLAVCGALSGCADTAYYLQSVNGHLSLLRASKPVEDWLADEQASPALKNKLALAQQIRRFAVTDLGLPDNASYTRYADLNRRAVVWNVVAAPEYSLALKTWCFVVAGCVGYRGYFAEADAQKLADELKAQGLEANVYPVPAYSTLGWLNWAGGDPLLNTFIHYPDAELARLLFHELAHQVAYVKDDTTFNESFATAVERLGTSKWLAAVGSQVTRRDSDRQAQRRAEFKALTQATKLALAQIYDKNNHSVFANHELSVVKKKTFEGFKNQYQTLRANWVRVDALDEATAKRQFGGWDAWVANANNAAFGAQAAYDDQVPEFLALFEKSALGSMRPWPAFYDAVKRLADLPSSERHRELKVQTQQQVSK